VVQAFNSAFGGSAGGVFGYTIANPVVRIAMLRSDPNVSLDDNRALLAVSTTPVTANGDLYNNMHDADVTVLTLPTDRRRIHVTLQARDVEKVFPCEFSLQVKLNTTILLPHLA
jgi:hypothetical protein